MPGLLHHLMLIEGDAISEDCSEVKCISERIQFRFHQVFKTVISISGENGGLSFSLHLDFKVHHQMGLKMLP